MQALEWLLTEGAPIVRGTAVLALRGLVRCVRSGVPTVLPLAEQAQQSPEVELRLAAVTAVRFVADPVAQVRVLAAETVEGFRQIPAYLPVFETVLRTDAVAQVRYMSLHAVGMVKELPPAVVLIRASAQSDPSEDVRKFALALVDSLAAP